MKSFSIKVLLIFVLTMPLAIPKKTVASAITLGVVLFDEFELLDVTGPLEMLGNVPKDQLNIITIAEKKGAIASSQSIKIIAEYDFTETPPLDILLVPGGLGTRKEVYNLTLLDWLKKQSAKTQITASVCTGSALLAKSGILDNHKATSNKLALEWVMQQSSKVEWIAKARWVDDGKYITSSGVSAGIDMSLYLIERLFGSQLAEEIAEKTEYIWQKDPTIDFFYEQ